MWSVVFDDRAGYARVDDYANDHHDRDSDFFSPVGKEDMDSGNLVRNVKSCKVRERTGQDMSTNP